MKHMSHTKSASAAKRIVIVAVMAVVCILSAVSVMASMAEITVVDGENSVTFEVSGYSQEKILEKAETFGIEPLNGLDIAILDSENDLLTIYREVEATVVDNDKTYRFPISSYECSKEQILKKAETEFGMKACSTDDVITYSAAAKKVTIGRAVRFTFVNGEKESNAKLYYGDTVADLLAMNNITVDENDELSHSEDTLLTSGMRVVYTPMFDVTVTADGQTEAFVTSSNTVSEVLSSKGITLSKDDEVEPAVGTQLSDGMEITVCRVEYKEETTKETIPYETDEEESDSLYIGDTSVETYGEEGIREITVKQKIVDGEVVETEEIKNEITKEPVTEVILVGTKEYKTPTPSGFAQTNGGTLIDHNGNAVSYSSVLTGSCTAYSGGGITATGVPAAYGNVAVNPNVIPYGTKLYICSPDGSFVYGYAIASDTGGSCVGGGSLADLYYDTSNECYQFGVRTMNVYIIG